MKRHADSGSVADVSAFNDQPGGLMYVMTLDVADGVVQTIRSVINPDKLRHLGPLADVRAMQHARQERR